MAKPHMSKSVNPSGGTSHAATSPRCVTSQVLLAGQRELRIQHGPEEYRLRHTASGKLILTK